MSDKKTKTRDGERLSDMVKPDTGIDAPNLSLKRIRKLSKILIFVSRMAMYSSLVAGIIIAVVLCVILVLPNGVEDLNPEFAAELVDALDMGIDVEVSGDIPTKIINAAQCIVGIIVSVAGVIFFKNTKDLFQLIIDEGKPFTRECARKVHSFIWVSLSLILIQGSSALIIIFVMLILASIFDYGVYLEEQHEKTEHVQEEVIVSFAEITEARSGQTGQHVKRVAEYTYIMARALNYSAEAAEQLKYASMMHDVGKLSIPLEILEKPGRLTDEEFEIIKTHTTEGERLLHNAQGEILSLGARVAIEHHEKWDGNGYPNHKAGNNISRAARIVAVADVFDALTSRRSYKEAWNADSAYEEIVKCTGTQFDPEVVESFKSCFDELLKIREKYQD